MEFVDPIDDAGNGSTQPDDQNKSSTFYFLRCVLLLILVVSPCIRAGCSWYTAGGRILVRRDVNGQVTGLQYIHPPPILSATGSHMRCEDHAVTCLTEEQVQALPEHVYKRKRIEGDDTLYDCVDGADDGVPVYDAKLKPAKHKTENMEEALKQDCTRDMAHSGTGNESFPATRTTTCSMCSICIEEFEDSETIVILPKCNHGFHLECIRPWLTERQSCCPLCKTNVLTTDAPKPESVESQDLPV